MAGTATENNENTESARRKSISLSDDDEVVFGGQVPRTVRQVTGITNLEKAKTLMTLSTAGVRTSVKANPNIGQSAYVPNPDLFKFSNPDRPAGDRNVAQNGQVYNGQPVSAVSRPREPSQPTFSQPTAARTPTNAIRSRYTRTMTWEGDGHQVLFGKFTHKSSCYLLVFSVILALMFGAVSISANHKVDDDVDDEAGSDAVRSLHCRQSGIQGRQ